MTALIWFTLDLRVTDLPSLNAAAQSNDKVIPLYILDENDPWKPSGAAKWWLHHSLVSLQARIEAQGGKLLLKRGATLKILQAVCRQNKVDAVYCTRAIEPHLNHLQRAVFEALKKQNIQCKRYSGRTLFEPDSISNKQGKPFQVFTPFYKHCLSIKSPLDQEKTHKAMWIHPAQPGDSLNEWQLVPQQSNWTNKLTPHWAPGEQGAQARLRHFYQHSVDRYASDRDFPGTEGTSRLAPHIHFGEISPRQIWRALEHNTSINPEISEPYLRQLMWREFSYYLLHHNPHMPEEPFKPLFKQFSWRHSNSDLLAWQQGKTGYPIVDAGMRELWATGWMHNRVRMIVASFLTKHLRLPWQTGAKWFWDTLVDADLANNSSGWQWVAGCGADAAPYFRIFNPILQGEKFDPKGEYIRRWVPEIGLLPNQSIHKPWLANKQQLAEANIELGKHYPAPIVDHNHARQAALEAYRQLKSFDGV